MAYYCVLVFLLVQLVGNLKGEPSLQIVKYAAGTKKIFSRDNIRVTAIAGANIALSCEIVSDQSVEDDVLWGWKRENVQFNSVEDLKKLADDNSKPLNQFLNNNKKNFNLATLSFKPLYSVDADTYFCMSLKLKLFKIVKVHVIANPITDLKSQEFDHQAKNVTNQDGPMSVSKVNCTKGMFVCNKRTSCVKNEYVCDNVRDCDDGSDENIYLCGKDPCAGKSNCSNGRCMSVSLCCNNSDNNYNCADYAGPSCCSEIVTQKDHVIDMLMEHPDKSSNVDDIPLTTTVKPKFTSVFNEESLQALYQQHFDDKRKTTMAPELNPPINFQDPVFSNLGIPDGNRFHSDDFDFQKLRDLDDELSKIKAMPQPEINFDDLTKFNDLDTDHYEFHTVELPRAHPEKLIFIPFVIIVLLASICKIAGRCRNRSSGVTRVNLLRISTIAVLVPRNNANSDPATNNEQADGNCNNEPNLDLPPSYDEAVVDVPQSAPLVR